MPKGALSLWFLAALLVAAGEAHSATLTAGQGSGLPGAADVPVSISLAAAAGQQVAALQFDLLFSSSVLSLPQVSVGAAAQAAGKSVSQSVVRSGRVRVIVAGLNQNAIADGIVAEAHFSIAAAAPDSVEAIAFTGVVLASPAGLSVPASAQAGAVTIGTGDGGYHSADYNPADWRISLSELLRAIQLYNSAAYSCGAATEDGYAPGAGAHACTPHDSDYITQDWQVSLSELLRLVQLFNLGAYHVRPGTEDGFEGGA